ncbi:kelch-like protein 24 [Acanthaster planci]|uniref:Kelch-like protein 24 n=1 Tax=Acanthaster planci TaxID=133434 RepID=A0A8B7Y4L6_ACAPL|nr:kelch-like protein 24 [Acanthaster planci]XP_022088135.1 kelch-like protein 24 [Acanthaster planci]
MATANVDLCEKISQDHVKVNRPPKRRNEDSQFLQGDGHSDYMDGRSSSSSFWSSRPRYDSSVPSILVSGIEAESDPGAADDVPGADEPEVDQAGGNGGSDDDVNTGIHHPHLAADLLAVLSAMRDAGDMTDVRLRAGHKISGPALPCHLAVVCAGSPLMEKSLLENYGDALASMGRNRTLNVPKMKPEILQLIIDFTYTSKMQITNQNAQELLQLCFNKTPFLGKSVEFACSEFLVGQFSIETESETSSTSAITSSGLSTEDETQSCQSSTFSAGQETCFHDYNYPLAILHNLNEQRHKKVEFTDLVLNVEGKDFPCHRAVLVALSPYFRAMFTSGMREFREKKVTLSDIKASIFSCLLDFLYTCKLRINEDTAQVMLETACFLQLTPAVSACSQFLKENMVTENCLGILGFAKLYTCSQLYEDAMVHALANFKEVVSCEEFLELPADILAAYIVDDRLNVKTEETVFEAVVRWARADPELRRFQLPRVLANVRLPLVDPDYFRNFVETEPLVLECQDCQELVRTAKRLRELSGRGQHIDDPNLKLRFSMTTQVIVIVGGYDDSQRWVRDVWCFNPRDESWHSLAPFPGRNQRFATVAVENDIYVIGGQADHGNSMSETLADVWRYDSITDTWSKVAGMNQPRHGHGVAVVDGKIYVVGGKMGWAKKFNDIERYDPASNIWACVTRVKGSYLEKPVATSHGGKLYVNGYFYRDPDIVHCYDPHDNSWTPMYSFQRAQGDAIETAVVLDDYIYFLVYRGYDNYIVIFNPATCERVKGGCKMPDGKYLYSYGATVMGDKIFVAGGSKLDASINVAYVQCYDPALDVWGVVGTMPHPLCEHGCVTIEKYMPQSNP